jgi:AraC-like DNA-binding protein
VSSQSTSDDASETVRVAQHERVPALIVLHAVLAHADEASLAARLHVSIRTLQRLAAGTVKMNWVTLTRLHAVAAELDAMRAAEREATARDRVRSVRRRETSGSYPRVAAPALVAS